jgi:hypothetical protein
MIQPDIRNEKPRNSYQEDAEKRCASASFLPYASKGTHLDISTE